MDVKEFAYVVKCKRCKYWWMENELCTHPKTKDGIVCVLECDAEFYCKYGELRDDYKHK